MYFYVHVPSFGHVEVKGQLAGVGSVFLLCQSGVVASALFSRAISLAPLFFYFLLATTLPFPSLLFLLFSLHSFNFFFLKQDFIVA